MKPTRILVALAVPVLLAACAYTRLQQPELSVVDVKLLKGDLFRQELRVRMSVHNPNDVKLPVRSISYQVELAGNAFAHGESTGNFEIPANGDTEFDVNVTANAASALLRLMGSDNQHSLPYRITGKVQLASGLLRSVPFDHTGQLQLR
jgi:LEA14-like dessication related protein